MIGLFMGISSFLMPVIAFLFMFLLLKNFSKTQKYIGFTSFLFAVIIYNFYLLLAYAGG